MLSEFRFQLTGINGETEKKIILSEMLNCPKSADDDIDADFLSNHIEL